jgi:hypothetical protein
MYLRRCNEITECQGPGGCGICHGGYRASTPPLSSSCPLCNASRALTKAGGMARANTTAKATTRTSTTAALAAMSCTQCQGVGQGHHNFMGLKPGISLLKLTLDGTMNTNNGIYHWSQFPNRHPKLYIEIPILTPQHRSYINPILHGS